ncbi:TniQ family protein [Paraburkholderia sp. UCT2]|uniref:TniQ family protein n=1 Tax=Paraburkholderia sp. UCT2 TaxID=2615208 RepID=UPI001655522F|nr:TniQ family protein [Paraburkholderia sp. UCT2]MBC8732303.1 hypothetical protein [Paraburkholderia sp. UCT2]
MAESVSDPGGRARAAFCAVPIERSGWQRQKLTDFVVHMASRSLVPVDAIVAKMLDWPTGANRSHDRGARPGHPFASGQKLALINGAGAPARHWVRRVEALTGQARLADLTLLPFADVLPDRRGLLNSRRRWCPACLQDDLTSGRDIYERLIWSLTLVTLCPVHAIALTDTCPTCGYRHGSELYRRSLSGFCARCHQWLGHCDQIAVPYETNGDHLRREQWTGQQLASLLDLPKRVIEGVAAEHFATLLDEGIQVLCDGNMKQFSRLCGRSPSSIAEWRAGKNYPSLPTLLDLSAKFGIPLRCWMTGERFELNPDKGYSESPIGLGPPIKPLSCSKSHMGWVAIEHTLREVVGDAKDKTSWAKLARRVNVDPSQLRRRYPDLARAIVAKARAGVTHTMTARHQARQEYLLHQVQTAIHMLLASGAEPTRRRIEDQLRKAGVAFRWADYPLIRRAWRNLPGHGES